MVKTTPLYNDPKHSLNAHLQEIIDSTQLLLWSQRGRGTASAMPDTNDSAGRVWVGIARSGPILAGPLARWCRVLSLPFLIVSELRHVWMVDASGCFCETNNRTTVASWLVRSPISSHFLNRPLQVRTAATAPFNGISVRIATARSTTRPARSSLLEDRAPKMAILDLCVFAVQHESTAALPRDRRPYKTVHQRVQRSHEALDASSLDLVGPVEIDKVCVSLTRRAASATGCRARVACPHVGVEPIRETSHQYPFWLTVTLTSGV